VSSRRGARGVCRVSRYALVGLAVGCIALRDARTACPQVSRVQHGVTLSCSLRSAAFPQEPGPSVAVHVPAAFDPWDRPGVVVYFHGWNGCVDIAIGSEDAPCTPDGIPRHASRLAAQLDDANVNALLVAVELRVDAPTGEPGDLTQPGRMRALLAELFREHLAAPLGVTLDVDDLDRVVLVAHSGGYQALAGTLRWGGLLHVREVVLLDALYGGQDVFTDALRDTGLRMVDLYTCCGGTLERSRAVAELAHRLRGDDVYDDDGELPLDAASLDHGAVFKRVPVPHGSLPVTYMDDVLAHVSFAAAR
jgi:hypothetical protein